MDNYFQSIVPVLFFISIGYIAKRLKLIDADIGRKLIKFLFTIPLPLVVFFGFANNHISINDLSLPIIAILLSSLMMLLSYLVTKILHISKERTGTILVATGISSTLLYVLPLVSFFYGEDGTRYLFLYDFGNGLLAWTVVYYLAGKYGNKNKVHISKTLISFLKNPMIWALILGVIVGFVGINLHPTITKTAQQISGFANPLLLTCVGVFLDFSFFNNKKNLFHLIITAILVMGFSFLIALGLINIFVLPELAKKVVLMCALAPAGSLTVAFSSEHSLDLEFASAIVALTMTIGVLLIPLLALM
jgi:hypothetical protein